MLSGFEIFKFFVSDHLNTTDVGQTWIDLVKFTLNIELFILVMHFDHFEQFETLSASNVNIENLNIQSKRLVMKYTRKSPGKI